MHYWQVMDNTKSPRIKYACTGCGCIRVLNEIDEHLERVCPNCFSQMTVRNYDFFVHKLKKENI